MQEMHLTEGNSPFICPRCEKTFVRKWTLNRHMNEQHSSILSEGEDVEEEQVGEDEDNEESNSEGANSETSVESEYSVDSNDNRMMPEKTINALLHMIGAGELGVLQVTTESLQCFITPNDIDDSNSQIIVTNLVLDLLKKLLLAAKAGEIVLTVGLYLDIINAVEKGLFEDE